MSPLAIACVVGVFVVCTVATLALFAGAKRSDTQAQEMFRNRRPQGEGRLSTEWPVVIHRPRGP